jgi:four helix bundle protein
MKDENFKDEGRIMKYEEKQLSKDYRNLRQRTKDFSILIIRMYSSLPKSTEGQVLGKQVLRSGTSVGANYREACRARSNAEFVAKVGDCLKELDETSYWFELIEEADILAKAGLEPLKKECDELLAIFTTIAKKCKAQSGKEKT